MKKITLILFFALTPFLFFGQQCDDPVADEVQYFCTSPNPIPVLNNLDVTVLPTATLNWYADAGGTSPLPGTTPIVSGTTYYVSQTDTAGMPPCTESGLVPITVYFQSLHLNLDPASCLSSYFGNNVFLVDPADTVEINLLDINGNPINGMWTPAGVPLYVEAPVGSGTLVPHFGFPFNTVYFQNAQPNQSYTFTVSAAAGACPAA